MGTELHRQHLLHGWVQRNHDGLAQKAGYPQECINEIHGSWFDPSNPVIKFNGSLRDDMFEDMETQAETADLVLVLGTSLAEQKNADQCVTKPANKSLHGTALGSVIISPQRTVQDGAASLRIFAKADDVMIALARELNLGPQAFGQSEAWRRSADFFMKQSRILVPYDRNGHRSDTVQTYWDLSCGQRIRISKHNNLEGARQPRDMQITADMAGVVSGDEMSCSISININGTSKRLGLWWLDAAAAGEVKNLPILNINPREVSIS